MGGGQGGIRKTPYNIVLSNNIKIIVSQKVSKKYLSRKNYSIFLPNGLLNAAEPKKYKTKCLLYLFLCLLYII